MTDAERKRLDEIERLNAAEMRSIGSDGNWVTELIAMVRREAEAASSAEQTAGMRDAAMIEGVRRQAEADFAPLLGVDPGEPGAANYASCSVCHNPDCQEPNGKH